MKRTDAEKLQNEYEKLVAGLQEANEHREDEDMLTSPGKYHCTPRYIKLIICSPVKGHAR